MRGESRSADHEYSSRKCEPLTQPGLYEVLPGVYPSSILPWRQVSRAGRFARATDRVAPPNQTIRVHRPKKSDGSIVSLDFEGHRRAHDEASRGKRSRRDRPRLKAEIAESESSHEAKAAPRAGTALSQLGIPVDRFCCRSR